MKFTPESHLKMASILLWAARATTGYRKPRLESLGHAFRIRAKQLAQSNGVTPDEPSLFDTQEDWENHLADLLSFDQPKAEHSMDRGGHPRNAGAGVLNGPGSAELQDGVYGAIRNQHCYLRSRFSWFFSAFRILAAASAC